MSTRSDQSPLSAPSGGLRSPRALAFVLVVAVCAAAGVAYVAWQKLSAESTPSSVAARQDAAFSSALANDDGGRIRVVFQNVDRNRDYAHIALVDADAPTAPRTLSGFVCERVYYAGGRGLCLVPKRGFLPKNVAKIFGPDLAVQEEVTLGGIPSRARVSGDGRYGATTSFVVGHSYNDDGFSTETLLIDMRTGKSLGNLEEFTVFKDGKRIESVDFNFWGVTFARDSNRFYATLGTQGKTYLVEGDVRARTARVLAQNVECPSLSPDNTRIAYKKRGVGGSLWRLHVLDLETMRETPLAERRVVDDQVEWLDDSQILYGFDANVWVVPADGSGHPRVYMSDALSPAVVH